MLFCNLLESLASKLQQTSINAKKLQQPIAITFKFVTSCNFNFKEVCYKLQLQLQEVKVLQGPNLTLHIKLMFHGVHLCILLYAFLRLLFFILLYALLLRKNCISCVQIYYNLCYLQVFYVLMIKVTILSSCDLGFKAQ